METRKDGLTYEAGKIPGVKVDFGGQEYIIPPLNIEGVEQHEEDIEKVQGRGGGTSSLKEKTGLICAIAETALKRNYTQVDLAFCKKWIDMRNMLPIFQAILGQSGFKEAEPGEVQGGLTGLDSTPAS